MATAYLTFCRVAARAPMNTATVLAGPPRSETVTTSGASAQGTKTAYDGEIVQVWCATTVVAVVGANPTATLAAGIVCPANVPIYLDVAYGDKIALIDG